ncbi:2-oxoglutarate dehydrogenase E1 component [Buchnera aphidicola]|uniref:oxoglutarate dehydrogenase (succinyl-transferring) n=1 Tax=Buchnera aphidicola (Stegophylla sp.) TaxID=2315800 RepID=A0A4D6Y9I5_9GAMM|nr:2-oxoglutarate dehydrogenase E1 component [Buchnera aphidicola (Stegophylla sp.)]
MNKKDIFHSNFYDLNGINQLYIEHIYQNFLNNSNSVELYWQKFFKKNKNKFLLTKKKYQYDDQMDNNGIINSDQLNELKLIDLFRKYGHQYANLDPIQLIYHKHKLNAFLLLYGFSFIHKIKNKNHNTQYQDSPINTLQSIYKKFKKIYCTTFSIEYMHLDEKQEMFWIQKHVENKVNNFFLTKKKKIKILKNLVKSEVFEKYLHSQFPGTKRFSLEGSESLIPALDTMIHYAVKKMSSKIIIGMAHRGRLNVLVNILKKNILHLRNEFSNTYIPTFGTGDAKYHFGMSSKIKIKNQVIMVDLKSNPSHLEIINPVVMGSSRAYIDQKKIFNSNSILPINIHGDSAIIGQGVNQETLNMSKTNGYTVGGTVHIIINNQIGFTTSNIKDIRSSRYCTDIAKMIQAPVFHVNADDPEAVIFIIQLALRFRYKFKKDIFIDLVCYRRHGHNEVDEPSVTQPLMYKKIKNHPTVCTIYAKKLECDKVINSTYLNNLKLKYRNKFDINDKNENYTTFNNEKICTKINILYNLKIYDIQNLAIQISYIPKNIQVHNRIIKIYNNRYNMAIRKRLFDWGNAEILAYATLLYQGIACRLSGEDVSRGTFFHRHAIIYDQNSGISYIPLNHLKQSKNKFYIWDSVLSEESVLAFEYGYSIDSYNTLNIWEAQFGDFVNGAQIVIDQFISSGEQKWGIKSKLVIFLPHGYEGQGPEHSSARIERFLQLCAQNNMVVCIPSTSSQIYHLIRYQALCQIFKPLIVISPKSLLRNIMSNSYLLELEYEYYKSVINEIDFINLSLIKKVILCSGKIYYELLSERRKMDKIHVILIRIERLYPFPKKKILDLLKIYCFINNTFWCQEEPKNQGAWYYIQKCFMSISNIKIQYIGRPSSAAPAVGSMFLHLKQQKEIINCALNIY